MCGKDRDHIMNDRKAVATKKTLNSAQNTSPSGIIKKTFNRENIEAIVIAIVLALAIRTFVVQAFKIPSGSMEPKVEAASDFVRRTGKSAVICDIGDIERAVSGKAGTLFMPCGQTHTIA